MFKRRIGLDPHGEASITPALSGCPDIWELDDGDFAIIGFNKTKKLKSHLPPSASCGSDEGIVVIPRDLLIAAKSYLPDA